MVVPDIAERTMKTCSPDSDTIAATDFMRSGVPTEVPPNFITFIVCIFLFVIFLICFVCHLNQFTLLTFINASWETIYKSVVVG